MKRDLRHYSEIVASENGDMRQLVWGGQDRRSMERKIEEINGILVEKFDGRCDNSQDTTN